MPPSYRAHAGPSGIDAVWEYAVLVEAASSHAATRTTRMGLCKCASRTNASRGAETFGHLTGAPARSLRAASCRIWQQM